MEGQAELERDLLRSVDALRDALTFLVRYDQLTALSRGEPAGSGGSVLADRVHEGLAAANRVLVGVRAGRWSAPCHLDPACPHRPDCGGPPSFGAGAQEPPGSWVPRIGHEPGE
ncbi:hypothetical protein [Polymorphospora rubra]|uniref:Uncharacterized protein n=1 Tax=Polymorphospora rubra TaxID=338584 RepID=A0A810MSZ6_9ACTN|nr:hypothetical protein [Polymorphospora rubra]BCJ63620.1 hypothetical protein Prubr_06410 [Polymorphospora rubra]